MSVVIVIPIYKHQPDVFEIASLRQCYHVLGKHTIVFIMAENFQPVNYSIPAGGIIRFDDYYFSGIPGYNKLMLSAKFYEAFSDYDFILIHQLDSYVFRDELEHWCNLNYDYIGAPWFEKFGNGNEILWKVGNGGFSLRKTKTFLGALACNLTIVNTRAFFHYYRDHSSSSVYLNTIRSLIKSFVHRNNIGNIVKGFLKNEDYFWCDILPRLYPKFNICPLEKAIPFSFDLFPEKMHALNNLKLPFACHAFDRNYTFWKAYISINAKHP